ncbi:hypothetical protein CCR85_13500 [Rhodothalassium salexigens]|uniref:RidA family protein n=1 Tax=Rhodothalassium salexigens TaxID=1086 RepID=UPI0019128B17|nr:RidA family protein [Rhodothalassium salexigens]MBK5912503.1 hypothetical protein [Rhodothalassium salexigens]
MTTTAPDQQTPRTASSGSPYETIIGFSRAIRRGPHIWLAGTGPLAPQGNTACPGDGYGQARRCLTILVEALHAHDARAEDVVRTRLLVTDMTRWEEIARAHGEVFGRIRPAATLVGVAALARPDWLVEIEAEAFIDRA